MHMLTYGPEVCLQRLLGQWFTLWPKLPCEIELPAKLLNTVNMHFFQVMARNGPTKSTPFYIMRSL